MPSCNAERMTDICPPATPAYPGIAFLRRAIRENTVSFPSQVPLLLEDFPSGMQWRTELLYFVHGWSSSQIALRFRVPKHRIWKIVEQWAVRALNHGYLQLIDADAFTHLQQVPAEPARNTTTRQHTCFVPAKAGSTSCSKPANTDTGCS